MIKVLRRGVASFLIFTCALAPISFEGILFQLTNADEFDYYDDYVVIDSDTTWSGNVSYPDKPVLVAEYATLTIEKGTHIEINSLIIDTYGLLKAEGTKEENIVFTKPAFDSSKLTDEQEQYDPRCFMQTGGMLEFDNAAWFEDDEESILKYVEFENMGTDLYYDGGNCPPSEDQAFNHRPSLFNTAYAEALSIYNPAISYNSGKLKIENSTFRSNSYTDIEVWMVIHPSQVGNRYDYLRVENSNFENNSRNAAVNSSFYYENEGNAARVQLKNNWYGAVDGPRTDDNPNGSGETITGPSTVDGWSAIRHENGILEASNVLFLPGLKASRLYGDVNSNCALDEDNMKKAWEPNCNDDVRWLYLDENGKSINSINAKTGDIIDETPSGANIYKSFIEKMDEMKNIDKSINDWKPVAYDWRLSLEDILEDGSIESAINDLAASSKTKKVTIVAHSNGGLLAKALMQKIGDEDAKNLVDKIIFVAVPQVGTPAAIAGLLHGKDQRFVPVLNTETARGFGENMPGAYNLLPSDKYFSTVETPVIEFKTQQSDDWKDLFDTKIDSKSGLHNFLADDFRRVSAIDSDTNTPAKLNEKLLENAENVHGDLDLWIAPVGIKIIQIAGWGVPDTLSGTEYDIEKKKYCDEGVCNNGADMLNPDFKFTIDGDGTVVTPSALWMSGVDRYWVNLRNYNKDNPFETLFGFAALNHGNILEIAGLDSFIVDNISNKTKSISEYKYLSAEVPPTSDDKRLQYSLHSPLTLELVDNEGRRTGIDADGQIMEQIPGTYFTQFGDVKYIFADEDISSRIEMKGYDTGVFTFVVEEFKGDEGLGKITFKDMPTTSQTKVAFNITNNLVSASKLNIDENGDGKYDYAATPILNGTVENSDLIRINDSSDDSNDNDGDNDDNNKDNAGSKKTNKKQMTAGPGRAILAQSEFINSSTMQGSDKYFGKSVAGYEKKDNSNLNDKEIENDTKREFVLSFAILILIIIAVILRTKRDVFKRFKF
ncbi:MAG: hypothetical protein PHP62_01160 [Candidatus Moranbacteria bacterium]|nr:hypothetical protein [Candidatus Moranbacteria bacterium]